MVKLAMTPEADTQIWIRGEELSDKSVVWNVHIGSEKFAAFSDCDAEDLAQTIAAAINEHTTHTADVIWE